MTSLKDVAALAGVSVTTVSRVINDQSLVDAGTRRRVEEAIEKLRYRPNLLAKGLRAGSGKMIGFVVPMTAHSTFSRFLQYVGDYSYQKGYNLVVGSHHNDPDIEERLIDSFYRRNIDGLILSLVSDESRVLGSIHKSSVPTIIIDRMVSRGQHTSVTVDNYRAGVLMAEHFLSLGHRKIGCVVGLMSISLARERLKGFRDTLGDNGVALDDRHICEGDYDFESGIIAAKKILQNPGNRPTAIWAQSDDLAAGVLKYASSIGISVPRELSIAGMDDNEIARVLTPSLTTIAQPVREMSEKAVDLIIGGKPLVEKSVITEPKLIIRESTAREGRGGANR